MDNKTLNESIARAMDCDNLELVYYLPYILQDFVEMGSSAEDILKIVVENIKCHDELKILDLGCGKGSVLCKLSEELRCECVGIDGVPEFIQYARNLATEKNLSKYVFVVGDIREEVACLSEYDVIILGSIGSVFGNHVETMEKLKPVLATEGIIVLDDGYIKDNCECDNGFMKRRSDIMGDIDDSGMEIKREYIWNQKDYSLKHEKEYQFIEKRCNELIELHPEKRNMFENYIKKQKEEYNVIENDMICSAMIVSRKATDRNSKA